MSSSQAGGRHTAAPAPTALGWVGIVTFAGIMLVILGTLQTIEGLTALYRQEVFLVTANGLVLDMDYAAWGRLHLALGLITLGTGAGVLLGHLWARITGVLLTFLGSLLHMLFVAASPVWCSILIGMDILIIFALTMHGGDVRRRRYRNRH